jgi:hypothetical protein
LGRAELGHFVLEVVGAEQTVGMCPDPSLPEGIPSFARLWLTIGLKYGNAMDAGSAAAQRVHLLDVATGYLAPAGTRFSGLRSQRSY